MTTFTLGAKLRADAQRLFDVTQRTVTPYKKDEAWRAIVDVIQQCLRMDAAARTMAESEPLSKFDLRPYESELERLIAGEPVAYVLGEAWFYGRNFTVNGEVLIPRVDTEVLVDVALSAIERLSAPRVLDIGTGSGCVAIAIALARKDSEVLAIDVSLGALEVASANARQLDAPNVQFARSDCFSSVANEARFDLIVSNPPYIAAGDTHLRALSTEPQSALVAGPTGLELLQKIIPSAPSYLNAGGVLAVEHGYDQAESVTYLFENAKFIDVKSHRDAGGTPRVVRGRLVAA